MSVAALLRRVAREAAEGAATPELGKWYAEAAIFNKRVSIEQAAQDAVMTDPVRAGNRGVRGGSQR